MMGLPDCYRFTPVTEADIVTKCLPDETVPSKATDIIIFEAGPDNGLSKAQYAKERK